LQMVVHRLSDISQKKKFRIVVTAILPA